MRSMCLIANPSEVSPSVYTGDECIAVCQSILEDRRYPSTDFGTMT